MKPTLILLIFTNILLVSTLLPSGIKDSLNQNLLEMSDKEFKFASDLTKARKLENKKELISSKVISNKVFPKLNPRILGNPIPDQNGRNNFFILILITAWGLLTPVIVCCIKYKMSRSDLSNFTGSEIDIKEIGKIDIGLNNSMTDDEDANSHKAIVILQESKNWDKNNI